MSRVFVNATLIVDHSDTEKVYHQQETPFRIERTLSARRERNGSGDVTILRNTGSIHIGRITEVHSKKTKGVQANGKEIL